MMWLRLITITVIVICLYLTFIVTEREKGYKILPAIGRIFLLVSTFFFLLVILVIVDDEFSLPSGLMFFYPSLALGHVCLLLLIDPTNKMVNVCLSLTIGVTCLAYPLIVFFAWNRTLSAMNPSSLGSQNALETEVVIVICISITGSVLTPLLHGISLRWNGGTIEVEHGTDEECDA